MTIDIKINDEWAVTSDENQFILNKICVSASKTKRYEEGEIYYSRVGFYHSIEALMKEIINKFIKLSDWTDFKQIITLMKEYKQIISAKLGGNNGD